MSGTDAARAAWATIAELDPEVWSAMRGEADRQRWKIELIASENYTFAAVDGGAGLLAHQQVRGGPAGQALLRRLRVRGRRGAARPGPRARAVPGRRARQRAAARGRPGQHGGVLRGPLAGRPDPRDEPRPRRPPHARLAGQLQRQVVRGPRLRRRPRRPSGSTTTRSSGRRRRSGRSSSSPGASCLLAHPRLRAPRGDRPRRGRATSSWTWRTSPGSSRPGCIRRPFPHADIVTTTTHKTLRGPRGAASIFSTDDDARARQVDKTRLPRHPGRAADARHRREGRGAPARRHRPSSGRTSVARCENARVLAAEIAAAGGRARGRAAPTTT